MEEVFSLARITALALADAVNPCAIAVLTMVIVAVMSSQDPKKTKKVFYSGMAFISSVFIGYIFYGIIMVYLFNSVNEFISGYSSYFYNGLAVLAMIIGGLQIKDYFVYKPGGIATEMPLWMRPKAKKIIGEITSPKGAFIIGFLVTVFLLPCTIGPYVIVSGLLSEIGLIKALPWLIYYNVLFVLPMALIVFGIYFGFKKVEDVSGWKERNIRRLHLIAGILLFLVGVSLLGGWI